MSLPDPTHSLLLLMGFSEPQDRCGAVMIDSAAGEIFILRTLVRLYTLPPSPFDP